MPEAPSGAPAVRTGDHPRRSFRAALRRPAVLIGLLAMLARPGGEAAALDLPLWEAGVGPTGLVLPDYRGSNQYRGYLVPFPYLVYRGDRFRIDRDRIMERLFNTDRLDLEVSLGGNVPVRSSRNSARQGMPDLDAVAEIGPALKWTALRSADRHQEVSVRIPIRPAIAVESSRLHFVGWTFQPSLGADWIDIDHVGARGWNAGALLTVPVNSRRYDAYYYAVDPAYATPDRAAYTAPGGAGGFQITLSTSKRFDGFWAGAYARYDSLAGARFAESPLVRTRQNFSAGMAISWVFWKSELRVAADR